MRKPLTRMKKLHRFHFYLFHEPLAKHVRILHGFLDFHFEGFLSIEMKVIFDNFDQKPSFFTFFTRVSGFRSKWTSKFHENSFKNDFSVLFARNPIEKNTRLTLVGTRISLSRLQNHTFSSFAHVYGVLASKLHHKFTIWCPTIPFLTPKWSQTSSASWPSLADPGWPARPPGPAGGGQAGPHLAGRWAASREGNEGRAQQGRQLYRRERPLALTPQQLAPIGAHGGTTVAYGGTAAAHGDTTGAHSGTAGAHRR